MENKKLSKQFICFYPSILVEFVEKTEKVFNRPITILEGYIEFNSDVIKNKMNDIIDEYKISFVSPESILQEKKQRQYNRHKKKGTSFSYKSKNNRK